MSAVSGGEGLGDLSAWELAQLDREIAEARSAAPKAPARTVGAVLLVGSVLGFVASFALIMDKFALLANPDAALACDINPFISCGTFLHTWQAATFGFPNMILGLAGYAIMGAVGSLYLSGTHVPRWFQWATFGGLAFAFAFILWLSGNALFAIHALCPWCLLAWAATPPMFFVYLTHLVETGAIKSRGQVRRVLRAWPLLSAAWYVLVIALIAVVFWGQWVALLA